MKEELFDKKIKELEQGFDEPVDYTLWNSIGSELSRRRRMKLIGRISAYVASAAVIVLGIVLAVNPFGKKSIVPADLDIVAETQTEMTDNSQVVEDETITVVQVPVSEYVAVAEVRDIEISEEVVKEESVEAVEMVAETVLESDYSGVVVEEESAISEVAEQPVLPKQGEKVAAAVQEELYGYEDYLLEEEDNRSAGSFAISAGGNMSAVGTESSYMYVPGPSFNVGGGQGVVENHSITPSSAPNHYFPISAGLNLTYSFLNEKMAVGLGFNYSYLYSKYEGLVDRRYDAIVQQSVHYIGIPVNVYYNIVGNEHITFYVNVGGMVERALKIDYDITTLSGEKMDRYVRPKGVQWSVNMGVGFEYRFVDFMGLYVDPRLTYYFPDKNQPFTVRSEQPLQFNLELGFRFHL